MAVEGFVRASRAWCQLDAPLLDAPLLYAPLLYAPLRLASLPLASLPLVSLRLALLLLAVLAVAAPERTEAQGAAAARLAGVVVDAASGVPIGGVEVQLAGTDTVVLRTDARGRWARSGLAAGRYTVRARRTGYAPASVVVETRVGAVAGVRLVLHAVALALDQVVITSARRPQRLADAVTTTEVVSREDIARTGASDLASVLVEQTGIELQGGHPAGAGLMLQGIGSERVLVLLDGQPVAGRISGVFDVSRIPVAVVERVEIVKGPQSTLYGSDAMGGVINIVTRTPERGVRGATITVTGGSEARREVAGSVTGGRGMLVARVDAGYRGIETTPGRSEGAGALAARSDGAAKLRWTPNSTTWLEAGVLVLDERQRWRSSGFYNFGDNRQWSGRLAGSWVRGRHRLQPAFSASMHDHVSRASIAPQPIAGDTGQRQIQRVAQGELLYTASFGAALDHALDVGVQVRRDETATDRVPGGRRSIVTVEPFAQLDLAATPALSVVPGIRVSRSSEWGTHVTPRLATRWRVSDRLTLRASVGEGFRAPDFKELFMFFHNASAGYAVLGNPDLGPETSRNMSLGAEWAAPRLFVRGQLFHNRFRDFIETRPITDPGEPPVFQYANVDDGMTRGLELEVGTAVDGWSLEGGYSGLSTRDDATGGALLGRPSHSGRLLVSRGLPFALRASVSLLVTGRAPMQRDETGAITGWRDRFTRIDARLVRSLSPGLELVLGADNLFNERPQQWAGFTGRHLYTALTWTFERMNTP